ncbi:hypothetical protein [Streptomyces sp.]|uniref:hypothetical protein n=1 Tax=Streptomyces sp. TaxID=1931 RepID=UPI002F9403CD
MTTFTDDFNRADGSPGASWVQMSGTWVIVSQQLSPGTTGGTVLLRAATAMASNDNYAQVTITATTPVSQGVWCRGTGTSDLTSGYAVRNNGSNWGLFSVTASTFTSIGTYSAAAVVGDVVKIQAVGSTITVYVNGVSRISVTNTAVASGTTVGIRSEANTGLKFDNFAAGDVTSGTTGDAALTGTATLSASGTRAASSSSALAATAALTTSGLRATAGDGALTSTAGLTASGTRSASGASSLAASASLTADGAKTTTGSTALTATADLTATGQRAAAGDTSLTATATLTTAGQYGATSTADLVGTAAIDATGLVDHPAQAGLTATADLAANGQVAHNGDAALTATATLTADGVTGIPPVVGSAALDATGTLTADGQRATTAGAGLAAAAVLTASGDAAATGTAGIAISAVLTAAGTTLTTRDDVDVTVGAPYSPWAASPPRSDRWTAGVRVEDWGVGAPW